MAIVGSKQLMMDMMIPSGSKPNHTKQLIPGMREFTMNEGKPTSIRHSKRGILPNVAVNKVGGDVKGKKDHEDGIGCGAIESIEKFGVDETMVGFVAHSIEFRANFVFGVVHEGLEGIDAHQLGKHHTNVHPSFPRVIGLREETKHPGDGEVRSQEKEPFWTTKVTNHILEKGLLRSDFLLLNGHSVRVKHSKVVIGDDKDLANNDNSKTHKETDGARVIEVAEEVGDTTFFCFQTHFQSHCRKKKRAKWGKQDQEPHTIHSFLSKTKVFCEKPKNEEK